MESSPLIKAHDHARAAAIATQTADTTVAISEHAQAAGEFANASTTTSSIEALRTLSLLEQHHRRLAELLKLPVGPPSQSSIDSDIPEEDEKEGLQDGVKATSPSKEPSAGHQQQQQPAVAKPPPSVSHKHYPSRNLSSSIASNLASARGIRAHYSTLPLTPSVSNDQAPGSLEVHPRKERKERSARGKTTDQPELTRKPSWIPPVIQEDSAVEPPNDEQTSQAPPAEEGFSRFYNTFGGLFNRIPLPLVFSGFPLAPEEPPRSSSPPPAEPTHRKPRHKPSASSAAEPDLSKIYSCATLRSLQRGGHGPADSFYVVPTSGHTASYASILNHERKEKRRLAASIHHAAGGNDDNDDPTAGPSTTHDADPDNEDDDDFVDARESQQASQGPPSPTSLRKRLSHLSHPHHHHRQSHGSTTTTTSTGAASKAGTRSTSDRDLRNEVEELHIENASLKDVLDKLSRRLHAFELNSQSSHLALAQSLRLQRPGSPSAAGGGLGPGGGAAVGKGKGVGVGVEGGGGGVGDEEVLKLRRRNVELEEQLGEMVKRMQSLEKDHLELQVTVERYRERWQKLKAGAKARIAEGKGSRGG